MQRVLNFLKENPTYYLGTVNGDQPEVRPFGTIHEFEGKLYFQTGRVKDVYKEIVANPKITICGWDGKGTWLRLNATAVEDARVEAEASLLEAYPMLQAMYAAGDGNTVVFYLQDATARFCSFTAPEEVERF